MARHAIDRAPQPWPTPQDRKLPATAEQDQQGARRRPGGALARPVAPWRHRRRRWRCWWSSPPEAMAWLRPRWWPARCASTPQQLADADVMQQRLALVSLPALAMVLRFGPPCWWWRWPAGVLAAAGTSACKPLQPKFEKIDPFAGLRRMSSPASSWSTRSRPACWRPILGTHRRALSQADLAALRRGSGHAAAGGDGRMPAAAARRPAAAGGGAGAVCRGRRAAAAPAAGADAADERRRK